MKEERAQSVAVVVPCYKAEATVEGVLRGLPAWVRWIVVVEDGSPDATGELLERLRGELPGLEVIRSSVNRGVGGAMCSGIQRALELDADIVVKIDADGQMDPGRLPDLLIPLLEDRADLAKGNRLRSASDVASMPRVRLVGNVTLTFLVRVATGYWHVLDPTNGYFAVTADILRRVRLDRLDPGYFFETSLLGALAVEDAAVVDVPMPAIYGAEVSSLQIGRVIATFPFRLLQLALRRIVLKHALYDVSPVIVYLVFGLLLTGFGGSFGLLEWWRSSTTGIPASSGTVALALLPFLLGFNLLLEAVRLDIGATPRPRFPTQRVCRGDLEQNLVRREPPDQLDHSSR